MQVTAHEGAPLTTVWSLVERPDLTVTVQSPEPLLAAQKRALDADYLPRAAWPAGQHALCPGRTGRWMLRAHPLRPARCSTNCGVSAVEQLAALQSAPPTAYVADPAADAGRSVRQTQARWPRALATARTARPQLHLLVRTPEQLTAALALHARPASRSTIWNCTACGRRWSEMQAAGIEARVASPRILKPNEQRIVNFLLRLGCPIVVRSAGLLQALQEADASSAADRRLQPQRRQRAHGRDLPGPGAGRA